MQIRLKTAGDSLARPPARSAHSSLWRGRRLAGNRAGRGDAKNPQVSLHPDCGTHSYQLLFNSCVTDALLDVSHRTPPSGTTRQGRRAYRSAALLFVPGRLAILPITKKRPLAQRDAHARVKGQIDRRNIASREPPVPRGTP